MYLHSNLSDALSTLTDSNQIILFMPTDNSEERCLNIDRNIWVSVSESVQIVGREGTIK